MGQPPMDTAGMPPAAPTAGGVQLPWRPTRRVLVALAVAGFTLLAVIGMALILAETAPGQATTRFLAFVALTGLFSLTALSATIPFARARALGLGWVGVVASGLAFLLFTILVLSNFPDQSLAQVATVAGNLAFSVALACLLLLVRGRAAALDGVITGTWVLLGLSFVLAVIQVFGGLETGGLFKLVAVVSILTFLGMIVVPLLALWMSSGTPAPLRPEGAQPPAPVAPPPSA